MALFDIYTTILAYEDSLGPSNGPTQKFVDWTRPIQRVSISNPSSAQIRVGPQATVTLFDGQRGYFSDGGTTFRLKGEPNSIYVLEYAAGQPAGFRARRDTDALVGQSLTLKANQNGTISISCAEPVFDDVGVGDVVILDKTFGPSNKGRWVVLSGYDTVIHLRPPLEARVAAARSGNFTATEGSFNAFSAEGVQAGDKIRLEDLPGVFEVKEVTDSSLLFFSPTRLPEAEIDHIEIYKFSKKFVRVETPGEVDLYVNGSDIPLCISPIEFQEFDKVGWTEICGPVHSLEIKNKENELIAVTLIAVE